MQVSLSTEQIVLLIAWELIHLLGLVLWMEIRKRRLRGKVWLIEQNSNNRLGAVQRVEAGSEGFQTPGGPFVKFEGDYAFWDRVESRPMFVYNGDTGFLVRSKDGKPIQLTPEDQKIVADLQRKYPAALVSAKSGETDEMDGNTVAAFSANRDIERFNAAGAGIDYGQLGLYATIIVGFVISGLIAYSWFRGG